MSKTRVPRFFLQPTVSFPGGAPDRAEYESDYWHEVAAAKYAREWREQYICGDRACRNRDCPQHFPGSFAASSEPGR